MNHETRKKALFELLLKEAGYGDASTIAIPSRDPSQPCPLSFSQQRLWLLDQLNPGNCAYNVPGVLAVDGALCPHIIEQTLQRIVMRHEILRSQYPESENGPYQKIRPPEQSDTAFDFTHEDISSLDTNTQTQRLEAIKKEEARHAFNLQTGPLLRVKLVSTQKNQQWLYFTMHHIICDEQSLSILAEEFRQNYSQLSHDSAQTLPRLQLQYGDYCAWQRQWTQGDAFNKQLHFWETQLEGSTPAELPSDKVPTLDNENAAGWFHFHLDADCLKMTDAFARQRQTTPFIILLSAFQALIYRHSLQSDFTIGTPVANREQAQTEHLIGFFTNTLVLRSECSPSTSFDELLTQSIQYCQNAFANQDIPFESIVESLQPERSLNRNPFFEILFVLQTQFGPIKLPDATMQLLPPEPASVKFDLTFTLKETHNEGYQGCIEYNLKHFTKDSIDQLAQRFKSLLKAVLTAPQKPLLDHSILSPEHAQKLLHGFNDTHCDFNETHCLHELVAAQAARTPQNIALIGEEGSVTYEQLNTKANRLAHYLLDQGARLDYPIGICTQRSCDMIIAVLAVLKAGAPYLPLDPQYPRERIQVMLDDSQARILLTDNASCDILNTDQHIQSVNLDNLEATLTALPSHNPNIRVHEDNLLYLIYTSGSTGKPKGIGLSHRALKNLILWHCKNLHTPSTTLQFASISFDVSFNEAFVALISGASLVIASDEQRKDIDHLVNCLTQHKIEKTILPVGIFQQLAAEYCERVPELPSLREIITTGEQLILTPAIQKLLASIPHCTLHNHYGPAETHVITAYPFETIPETKTPPPIGKPIANTQIYILDERLNPVPIGVYGHLYAGGTNLARGYHNQPALTAERFIPSPFSQDAQRLYHTGDIARFLPDGNIEFLGRSDGQLKIRGYRVEPGEIETAILKHPLIQKAAVIGAELQQNRLSLVAYYTTQESTPHIPQSDLREFTASLLPDYMVPSLFIPIEAMPLTPSGKIKRSALPKAQQFNQTNAQTTPPSTAAETLMAHIWSLLLERENIGVEENFFDLGGHSLLATRLVSRVRADFGLDLNLKDIFEEPTIQGLVNKLAQAHGGHSLLNELAELSLNYEQLEESERSALLKELS